MLKSYVWRCQVWPYSTFVNVNWWNTFLFILISFPLRSMFVLFVYQLFVWETIWMDTFNLHTKCCPIVLFCMLCGWPLTWHHLSWEPFVAHCWLTLFTFYKLNHCGEFMTRNKIHWNKCTQNPVFHKYPGMCFVWNEKLILQLSCSTTSVFWR